MSTVVIERTTPSSTRLRFVWKGGPYIDIFWAAGEVPDHVSVHHEGHESPFMAINVYDYAKGHHELKPDADGSFESAVAQRADEWIEERSQDYGLG